MLGHIPKRPLFAMVNDGEFPDSLTTNPFKSHFDLTFLHCTSTAKIPSGGLRLDTDREKGSVIAYRTLFEGSGIRLSNSGLQISHASFVNEYFMRLFDLTPDLSASEGHTSHSDSGIIRIEERFYKALPHATT